MELKKALVLAIVLSIIGITAWEMYWRAQGKRPTLNDEKALWAWHRAKVENASRETVVILGSSRAYFDIQLEEWEAEIGKPPIQLSSTGSSPLPTFHDIVNNTNFNGTVVVGVTPGLFFSTTYPEAMPWKRPQSKVDYYKKITYAQRSNYQLSIPLQNSLVLMSGAEEEWSDDIDLKSLIRGIHIGNRTGGPVPPPFFDFGEVNTRRNLRMTQRASSDTAFANTIIKVWKFFGEAAPPPDKESTMAFFMADVKKFKEKGGNLILLRCPSSGGTRVGENHVFPRGTFWDDLVKQCDTKAYHFEDYDQLKNLKCPEESHLSAEDARFFTTEIARIIKNDEALIYSKTN